MVLVVGGSGDLGSRIVRRLRDGGAEVRCLVRPGTDEARLRGWGVAVVRGALTDPASLRPACEGVATAVATATSMARGPAGARRPQLHQVDEVGMASLVEAAAGAG